MVWAPGVGDHRRRTPHGARRYGPVGAPRVYPKTAWMNTSGNENKRQHNLEHHGVDFRLAALIFQDRVVEAEDERDDYGETRYRRRVLRRRLHMAGWQPRIISAWKVDEDGKRRYQALLAGRTPKDC
jgi:uncharacterized DUF497 family protein